MKQILDLKVKENLRIGERYCRLTLSIDDNSLDTGAECTVLPEILPGQFVEVLVPDSGRTFLRRPISVNNVSVDGRELQLLIQVVGNGTQKLSECEIGDTLNIMLPLGNSFPLANLEGRKILLIGGGIGIAPLYYYGKYLVGKGLTPTFLIGARSKNELLFLDEFEKLGVTHVMTNDGTAGHKGLITESSLFCEDNEATEKGGEVSESNMGDAEEVNHNLDVWVCCGPSPMMKAVAALAKERNVECYFSLENRMACGIGACLCCVEKTVRGNRCVCKDGPVFNLKDLVW